MKNKYFKLVYLVVIGFALAAYSCADLNVENLNEPDAKDVLATPGSLIKLGGGAYRVWHNAIQEYSGPALAMGTMADQLTCSWGNVAMQDLSSEPRAGFNNDITYANASTNRDFWNSSYSALSQVNDVLKGILVEHQKIKDQGVDITGMMTAWGYFMQGVLHGYLGLIFDKAFIINYDTDLETLDFSPYQAVSDFAVARIDSALKAIDDDPVNWTLPDGFIRGTNLTKIDFRKLVSSFGARILAYTPRNAAQNAAVDWSRVLTFAQNGIDYDLAPNTDDNTWIDNYKGYGVYPGWVRIDHRIINLMDHSYPSRWPDDGVSWTTSDGKDPGPAVSNDARLASDFEYLADNNFHPDRGYYHFSHYRYARYDDWLNTWQGPAPTFRKWENDMLIAEALVRANNDVAGAVAILNDPAGARKLRGNLPDVSASIDATAALEDIFYERDVELILTTGGTSFFDMRRRDMLQEGTILHFPVPAAELEIRQLPNYTISGSPDGENISMGHWVGYDGLVSPEGWSGK